MDDIRRRVAEKQQSGEYADDPAALEMLNFTGFLPQKEDERRIALLQAAANVEIEGEPISSHRPVAGAFIKAIKKLTRFWIRKYTDPIFLRQSMFNDELLKLVLEQRGQIEELKRERENRSRD